jgi:hypothetical protein
MKITRRAFFTHPTRISWEDPESAGEWLRRAGRKRGVTLPAGSATVAAGAPADRAAATGVGLRNAIANVRREEHEQ